MNLALKLIAKEKANPTGFLDLGNCNLTELPDALFELTHLEGLSLSTEWHEYDFETNEGKKLKPKTKAKPIG